MKLGARHIVQVSIAIDVLLFLVCGIFWCFSSASNLMVEYPTRPIIQLFFAVNMLPNVCVAVMWFTRSRVAGILYLGALFCHSIRTYITQQDAKFLSGQSGLMGNFFTCAFMGYTATLVEGESRARKSISVLYSLSLLLLIHYMGRYLHTGSDAAVKFFQVIAIVLSISYNYLAVNVLAGEWGIDWVKQYTA